MFPGDDGFPGEATTHGKIAQFAPRVGAIWTPGSDQKTSVRAAWGIFYDTPHLFFNTRFANNPPWGAQITISNPPGGWADPYLGYPGGNPFPELNTDWETAAFPAFGVYVNTPINMQPTALHQWNISAQRQFGEWLMAASYLGNHSVNLWRATELNPAVVVPGATTGNTNQRRLLIRQNPVEGQFYGTIGHVDDTGRSNYNGLLLSAQRRLKSGLSVLSNWTISKCMADPATTEITGPTITDPNNRTSTTRIVRPTADTYSTSRSWRERRSSQTGRSTRCSATGRSRRWFAGRAATAHQSPRVSTTR